MALHLQKIKKAKKKKKKQKSFICTWCSNTLKTGGSVEGWEAAVKTFHNGYTNRNQTSFFSMNCPNDCSKLFITL